MRHRFALSLVAGLALTAAPSGVWAQAPYRTGTRTTVVCGGRFIVSCTELTIQTTMFSPSSGAGNVMLGIRNLQGSHPLDNTLASVFGGINLFAFSELFPPSSWSDSILVNMTSRGEVRGRGAPAPWTVWANTRKTINVATPFRLSRDDNGKLFGDQWGVAGCAPFSFASIHPTIIRRTLEAYGTCPSGQLPGMAVLSFDVNDTMSPNFFEVLQFGASGFAPDGSISGSFCSVSATNPEWNDPFCSIQSDTYSGDVWGNPYVAPEPAALVLVATGLLGLAPALRRRHRRSNA